MKNQNQWTTPRDKPRDNTKGQNRGAVPRGNTKGQIKENITRKIQEMMKNPEIGKNRATEKIKDMLGRGGVLERLGATRDNIKGKHQARPPRNTAKDTSKDTHRQ